MKGCKALLGIGVILVWPVFGQAMSPYRAVQQGNVLYQVEQYAAALELYTTANQALPEAAEIHFNQGNVFYKQQNYARALASYTEALHRGDRLLESHIKYNLGNVEYQQALQAIQNPEDALQHLYAATIYYRDSLEIDPKQLAARYNLELAQRLRHQLLRQDGQQPSPQGKKRQKAENQGEPSSQRQPQSQQHETPQDEPQDSRGQQANPASQTHASPDSGRVGTRQMATPQKLSLEEAERRLDVIRQRAREIDKLRQQWQRARMRDARMERYW